MSSSTLRLMTTIGTTNLAFWLIWPAGVVRVEQQGWGATTTGAFGSAAWLAAIVGLMLVPSLTQRAGFRATTAISCSLLCLGGIGSGLLPGGVFDWVSTALIGLGFGLRWGAVDAWFADTTEPARRGRILSITEMIAGATAALGPALAAVIVPAQGMLALGLVAAALPVLGLLACCNVPAPSPIGSSAIFAANGRSFVIGVSPTVVLVILVAAALGGFFESGFTAAASLIALAEGASDRIALLAAAAIGLGSFPAQYLLGRSADLRGGCVVLLFCSAALAPAMLALAVWPGGLLPISLVVGVAGGGLYTVAVIFGLQASPATTGSSAALISAAGVAYAVGSLLSPLITGTSLAMFGASSTLFGFAALASTLLGLLLALRIWRRRRPDPTDFACDRRSYRLRAESACYPVN